MPTVRIRVDTDSPMSALRALSEHGTVLGYQVEDETEATTAATAAREDTDADLAIVRSPKTRERDLAIVAAYAADPKANSTVKLAEQYGLSRERVCQVLRRANTIETVGERKRAAAEALRDETAAIRAAAKADYQERMTRVVNLVKQGFSIKSSVERVGFPGYSLGSITNAASKVVRAAGVPLTHGRHIDRASRYERVRELAKTAKTLKFIVKTIRSEGDTINEAWIYNRMPEIAAKYANSRGRKATPL